MLLKIFVKLSSEWHANNLPLSSTRKIFASDTIFLQEFHTGSLLETDIIYKLHVFRSRLLLAIDIDIVVFDLQGLTCHRNTTLDVVLTSIHRTGDDFPYLGALLQNLLSNAVDFGEGCTLLLRRKRVARLVDAKCLRTGGINKPIIVLILEVAGYGVARRIVEHYDIPNFHSSQTFHTTVVPLWPLDITLTTSQPCRKIVLSEGHREGSLWDARTITQLRH